MTPPHWLIRGGRVIDPSQAMDGINDVELRDGKVFRIAPAISAPSSVETFDAAGRIVCPGLVDLHTHVFPYVTGLGVDADSRCIARGVTTVVDAGSAGAATFAGFRRHVVAAAHTRVLALVNISMLGLVGAGLGGSDEPGELESLRYVSAEACSDCVSTNLDIAVGVKIRLSASIAAGGANEAAAYERAQSAARQCGLPLMVHHTLSTVPLESCPGGMQRGDIYTHCFHGFPSTIVTRGGQVHQPAHDARSAGVLFDVGNGQGSFNWTVAEACARAEFWPDTISTDLHSGCCDGPAYDLPTVMSRLLALGMPLSQVIAAATVVPARAIGWSDRIGTLRPGAEADVTILELREGPFELEDCQSQTRRVERMIEPAAVWKGGVRHGISGTGYLPDVSILRRQLSWWDRLEIRDPRRPVISSGN